jgi:hypothetical protein
MDRGAWVRKATAARSGRTVFLKDPETGIVSEKSFEHINEAKREVRRHLKAVGGHSICLREFELPLFKGGEK